MVVYDTTLELPLYYMWENYTSYMVDSMQLDILHSIVMLSHKKFYYYIILQAFSFSKNPITNRLDQKKKFIQTVVLC